jgi:hypothetical protein
MAKKVKLTKGVVEHVGDSDQEIYLWDCEYPDCFAWGDEPTHGEASRAGHKHYKEEHPKPDKFGRPVPQKILDELEASDA